MAARGHGASGKRRWEPQAEQSRVTVAQRRADETGEFEEEQQEVERTGGHRATASGLTL